MNTQKSIVTVTKRKLDPRFNVIIVFFFIFTVSAEFNFNFLICLGLTVAMLVFCIRHNMVLRLNTVGKAFFIMFLAMLASLRGNSDSSVTFWLYWIIGLLLALCWDYGKRSYDYDINKISRGWVFLGGIGVIVVFLSKLSANFYLNTLGKIISDTTRQYNIQLLSDGYSASICRGITYTCYFLAIAMFFVLCGTHTKRTKIISTIIFAVALIATGRRSETVAAIAAVLAYFSYSVNRKKKSMRKLQVIIGLAIVASLLYLFWPWLSTLTVFYRYTRTLTRYRSGMDITSGRIEIYKIAWRQFMEHPVFGVGWSALKNYVAGFNVSNAHDVYLQLLCETGVVGTALILPAYIITLVKSIKILNAYAAKKITDNARQLCMFSLMLQVFFLVTGIFDNPIYKPVIGMFYSLIIICVNYADKELKRVKLCEMKNTVDLIAAGRVEQDGTAG